MKLNRLLLLLAIVVPVVACIICLNALKEINEETKVVKEATKVTTEETQTTQTETKPASGEEEQGITQTMAGEEFISKIGEPISKHYTDASVAVSVANIYKDSNELSDIVETVAKYDVLKVAQKYPQGWTRVQTDNVSGWMRTENIFFPEGKDAILSDGTAIGKTGVVTADPSLNMRASASLDGKILTTVPHDASFTILDSSNGWYKVTYASTTGWVSAEYIELR